MRGNSSSGADLPLFYTRVREPAWATGKLPVLNTNWATAAPTNGGAGALFRRVSLGATIGNGIIWTFDREPLEVVGGAAATSELCLCNSIATAPGTIDVTFVYDE